MQGIEVKTSDQPHRYHRHLFQDHSSLSDKIASQIDKLNIGEFTNPITTPGGFIVLKILDKKDELLEIDKDEQFKKALNFERNRQLTKYSTLHYKRVYNKAVINEF